DEDRAVAELGFQRLQGGDEPLGRFVEDEGPRFAGERGEGATALALPARREALEGKTLGGKAGDGKRRGDRRRTRHRFHAHAPRRRGAAAAAPRSDPGPLIPGVPAPVTSAPPAPPASSSASRRISSGRLCAWKATSRA